jgi:hypothetical protein
MELTASPNRAARDTRGLHRNLHQSCITSADIVAPVKGSAGLTEMVRMLEFETLCNIQDLLFAYGRTMPASSAEPVLQPVLSGRPFTINEFREFAVTAEQH